MAVTPNYGLTKPVVGADTDAWGAMLNGNFDIIDTQLFAKADKSNPVFTGILTAPVFKGNPDAILRAGVDSATAIQFQTATTALAGSINTLTGELTMIGAVVTPGIKGKPKVYIRPETNSADAITFLNSTGGVMATIDTTVGGKLTLGPTGLGVVAPLYSAVGSVMLRPGADAASGVQFQNAAGTALSYLNTSNGFWQINGRVVITDTTTGSAGQILISRPNAEAQVILTSPLQCFVNYQAGAQTWFSGAKVVDATASYDLWDQTGAFAPIRCLPASTRKEVQVRDRLVVGGEVGSTLGGLSVNGSYGLLDSVNATKAVARFVADGNGGIAFGAVGITNANGYRRGFYWSNGYSDFGIVRYPNAGGQMVPDLYVAEGGNVGIGVAATQTPYGVSIGSYAYAAAPGLTYRATGPAFGIDVPGNAELVIGWQGAAPFGYWMQVRGNGNVARPLALNPSGGTVGIGTANPMRQLHIANGDYPEMLIEATTVLDGTANGRVWGLVNGSGAFSIRAVNSAVSASGVEFKLFPNGEVAFTNLGTTNPGAGSKKIWADPADGYRVKYAF